MSILEQTYQNIELIIINDNSIDDTLRIIRAINDKRIKLIIIKKKYGQSISMNIGLEIAEGALLQGKMRMIFHMRIDYLTSKIFRKRPKCVLGNKCTICDENEKKRANAINRQLQV